MMAKDLLTLCVSFSAIILLEIPQVNCKTEILDMAPNTFDDQYLKCEGEMYEKIRSTNLLQKELKQNKSFSDQWKEAQAAWPEKRKKILPPKVFKDEYGIAIMTYTGPRIYRQFNEAVRVAGQSKEYYMRDFHFKSLHFYLTRGLQLLRESCIWNKQKVYRGVMGIEFEPKRGSKSIRFGQFTSTSLDLYQAKGFGTDSFFTIETCFGVKIAPFSLFPFEKEVLIPPNEVFKVTNYTVRGHQFKLTSTKRTSNNYNCAYLRAP